MTSRQLRIAIADNGGTISLRPTMDGKVKVWAYIGGEYGQKGKHKVSQQRVKSWKAEPVGTYGSTQATMYDAIDKAWAWLGEQID